jgi:hypothetical protein
VQSKEGDEMKDILFWLAIIPSIVLIWVFAGLLLLQGWGVFKEWRGKK